MKVEFCVSSVVNIMMKEAVICNFKQQLVQWNGMVYLHREMVQSNFCNSAVGVQDCHDGWEQRHHHPSSYKVMEVQLERE